MDPVKVQRLRGSVRNLSQKVSDGYFPKPGIFFACPVFELDCFFMSVNCGNYPGCPGETSGERLLAWQISSGTHIGVVFDVIPSA